MTENNRILVIDDNPEIHEDFHKILDNTIAAHTGSALDAITLEILGGEAFVDSKLSYQLDFAHQGEQGLEKAQTAIIQGLPYAVAFIDIRMPPGLDGIETIEKLWQIDSEIQTVIISAYSDYNFHDITKRLGETDRLLIFKKPFENFEIRQMAFSLCKKWNLNRNIQLAYNDLEISKQRYADLYNKSPDMYISTDTETGLIIQCNNTTAETLGYSKDELPGKPLSELIHPDSTDKNHKLCNYLKDTDEINNAELYVQKKDKSKICVNMSATTEKSSDGNLLYTRICWVDITLKKQLEISAEVEHTMSAIAQLAGGVAHEFNNTVTIIVGNLDLLASKLDDAQQLSKIETIKKSAQRAVALTRHLARISKINPTSVTTSDLNNEIKQLHNRFESIIPDNINHQILCQENICHVDIDQEDFSQSLINLVKNACEAMTKGGNLIIETSTFNITDENSHLYADIITGKYAKITIKDTGCGIHESTKKHIYEPFYTSHEFGKNKGLGLAFVFAFVKRSAGFIECDSEIGVGTEFRIFLPCSQREQLPVSSMLLNENSDNEKPVVLILDNEPFLVELAAEILTQEGYEVLRANSIRQAMYLMMEEKPIDLFFGDAELCASISGLALGETINQRHPEAKLLLCQAFKDITVSDHNELFSNSHTINKPYTPAELTDAASRLLTGS